jgi:hypothetical protein
MKGSDSPSTDPSSEELNYFFDLPPLKNSLFPRSQLTVKPTKPILVDSETQTPITCDIPEVFEETTGTPENIPEYYTCSCPICGDTFKNSRYLRVHVRTHGPRLKTQRCIRCGVHVKAVSVHLCAHDS